MRRMTGAFGLASVGIWLVLCPLYTMQPPVSLYGGAAAVNTRYGSPDVPSATVQHERRQYVLDASAHLGRSRTGLGQKE
jgi:hypothetical protein